MIASSPVMVVAGGAVVLMGVAVTLLLETAQGRQILAGAVISLALGIGSMQLLIRRALS